MKVVDALLPEILNPKAVNPLDFAWQTALDILGRFNSICSFRLEFLDIKEKMISLTFMSFNLNSLKRIYICRYR